MFSRYINFIVVVAVGADDGALGKPMDSSLAAQWRRFEDDFAAGSH